MGCLHFQFLLIPTVSEWKTSSISTLRLTLSPSISSTPLPIACCPNNVIKGFDTATKLTPSWIYCCLVGYHMSPTFPGNLNLTTKKTSCGSDIYLESVRPFLWNQRHELGRSRWPNRRQCKNWVTKFSIQTNTSAKSLSFPNPLLAI